MESLFSPSNFFDLSDVFFADFISNFSITWEAVSNLESYIKNQFSSGIFKPNYSGQDTIFIGEGSIINEGAFIKGPAIIGENCVIGHGALLRENCLIGDNAQIGHAVEIKNSIVMNHSKVAHLNYVGDSVVGCNVNISGGAMLANFRLDKHTVTVKYKEEKIDTKLMKFGSVVGDNTVVGANAVLNPGTILGKNCAVFPLASVSGYYPSNETIK